MAVSNAQAKLGVVWAHQGQCVPRPRAANRGHTRATSHCGFPSGWDPVTWSLFPHLQLNPLHRISLLDYHKGDASPKCQHMAVQLFGLS